MRAHSGNWFAAVALSCACGLGMAHELPANRLTLVQREPAHVSLISCIDYAQALHRLLAPRQGFREFALMHAAMEPGAWAQVLLREHAMRAVVAPWDHEHDAPTEILAELVARSSIGQITLKLPDELQAVLVVSYRPTQAWAKPGAPGLTVKF